MITKNELKTAEFIEKITEGLNAEQKQAVENDINSCTKIVAGAGTGKTKIISKRFVKLIADLINEGIENPATRLLVMTFTDKASGEMKDRIVNELKNENIDFTGQDLWISSYHSFSSRILKKHSIEANLSPSFKMGDEKQLKEIYDNIIKRIKYGEANTIQGLDKITASLGLTPEILSIESVNKLNKINAIEIILDEIFPIIKKIKSQGIEAKEFLDKSKESINKYTEVIKEIPFKFDSKESYAEAWAGHLSKYTDDSCIFDTDVFDKIAGAKLILDKFGKRKAIEYGYAEKFPECIDKIEETEIHLTKIIAIIYAVYQNELEKLDLVDFDDLINKTIQILKQNEVIRIYYQKLFKHIIIDEFQDTNGSQLELIKLLLDSSDANVTFVGDRKQSIYSFRFAQMENLEVLHKHIEEKYNKKYEPIELKYNYRSTPHVLDAVNHVTKQELNLEEILSPNPNPREPFESENKHVKVTPLTGFSDAYNHKINESNFIASEIIRIKKEENASYKDFAVLVKSHSQAELIEKQLANAGIPSIKKVNIGFFINPVIRNTIALLKFAASIRDELAFVRILKIKLSDQELYNLKIQTDKEIINTKTFDELKKMNLSEKLIFVRESKIFENLEVPQSVKDYTNQVFETVLLLVEQKNTLSLLQVYYRLINEIKPYYGLTGIDQYRAELDLRIFEKIIADFMQGENYVSICKFLDYIDRIKDDRNFELPSLAVKDIDAVQLLTIHASKGLEFPYTFIASIKTNSGKGNSDGTNISFDLQYGNKPGFGIVVHKFEGKATPKALLFKELWKKPRDRNKALRLFYVAISRAEKYLNILSFEPYNKTTKPADYIQGFPAELLADSVDTALIEIEKQELKPFISCINEKCSIIEKLPMTNSVQPNYKMSFSRINTFNHCQNKYLLKYKYGYPEIGEDKKASMVGNIIHNLIYSSYLSNKEFSKQEIDSFISGLNLEMQDIIRVKALYSSFLNSDYSPQKLVGKEIYPEKSFNFSQSLGDEIVEFSGDIDLLIKNIDDTYEIIDFKTNKDIEKSLNEYYKQLYLYKMALSIEGININQLKILNLTDEAAKIFEPRQEVLSKSKSVLDEEISKIIYLSSNPICPQVNDEQKCMDCSYLYICENSYGE